MKNIKSNIVKACADYTKSRNEIKTIERKFASDHQLANVVICVSMSGAGLLAGNLVQGAIRSIARR